MRILKLPCDGVILRQLTSGETIAAIWVRRLFIRYHRHQTGDDRCFLDDWLVWQLLSDTPGTPHFGADDGMVECSLFYAFRREEGEDTLPDTAIVDPEHWDDDLWTQDTGKLTYTLMKLQESIRTHRDIGERPRTVDDDRVLYRILPEKLPADFRLPPAEAFLGEARAPSAGCPSFWLSHLACRPSRCNQHGWGPC